MAVVRRAGKVKSGSNKGERAEAGEPRARGSYVSEGFSSFQEFYRALLEEGYPHMSRLTSKCRPMIFL